MSTFSKQKINYFFQTVPTHPPVILPLDLTEINALNSEVEKVLKIHGRVDILINNAGISYRGEVENTNVDVYIKVMLINYFAQVAMTKGIFTLHNNNIHLNSCNNDLGMIL